MKKVTLLLSALVLAANLAFAAGSAPMPTICNRACWNARAPQGTINYNSGLNRAVIHHTASSGDYNVANIEESKVRVRAIQNYSMDGLGYADTMYNFTFDKLGNTFEMRYNSISSYTNGAHDGTNYNSIGVTLLGYYHSPYNQIPTAAQKSALYDLIAWKIPNPFTGYGSGTYNSKTCGYICGHRDVKATGCPGDQMYWYIGTDFYGQEARNEVNARIFPPAPAVVIVDDASADFSASANWWTSSYGSDRYGVGYHCRATEAISDMAAWNVNLPTSGTYKVYAMWSAGANRPANIGYQIYHNGGQAAVYANQQANGGVWNLLGTYSFPAGASQKIKLSCWTTSGFVAIADAVKFERQ